MLSKEKRIPTGVLKNIKGEKQISTPYFSIKQSSSPDKPRVAVVVSSKVASKAVKRNLLRRRIYNVLANLYEGLGNFYLVIYTNKKTMSLDNKGLSKELEVALAKAGSIKVR